MARTLDALVTRFGVPGNATQPLNFGITASTTIYRGCFAITPVATGLLVQDATASTNKVWGVIDSAGPGTADTGPGIVGTTSGAITANVATGTFFFACSTGSDALTTPDLGAVVYVYDQGLNGYPPTVAKTDGSASRPVAGVLMAIDSTQPGGFAVKVGSDQSTGSP